MPYLRITCAQLSAEQRRSFALHLTDEVNHLFFNPRGGPSQAALREQTTVHFIPYGEDELFIGGRSPAERGQADITVELSDWSMGIKQRRKIAAELTPVLAKLFGVPPTAREGINIRFHAYSPSAFAVGGTLLSDLVPQIGQVMKRLST